MKVKGGDGAAASVQTGRNAKAAGLIRGKTAKSGRTSAAKEDAISAYLHGTSSHETGDTRRP